MTKFASAIMPIEDEPEVRFDVPKSFRMKVEHKKDRFFRDYTILLVGLFAWAASIILFCTVTGAIVRHNDYVDIDKRIDDAKTAAVEEYKSDQARAEQAAHWKSGEASREAAMNQDVDLIARWMSFFKTDRAKMSFGGNVIVRILSPFYPNDVRSVLTEKDQFTFGNENLVASAHDQELAAEIWNMIDKRILPAGLTMDHLYGEVRDGGNDYVVRNEYEKTGATDYWRYS